MESSLSPTQDTSAQLAFLKNASDKRVTRDGNPPKRRGPKPDSRPALTRRQELNRQAQRTHRERKELYIKALEDEVLRLKEIYSSIAQDKDRLADENRQLRQMLTQQQQGGTIASSGGHGPSAGPSSGGSGGPSLGGGPGDDTASNPSVGYSGSASGSYGGHAPSSNTSVFTPPPHGQRGMISPTDPSPSASRNASQSQPSQHHQHQHQSQHHYQSQTQSNVQLPQLSQLYPRNASLDYEQAGIDFVLTLEKPCMEHMPWILEHSAETGSDMCGHALMASCPPRPFFDLPADVPFGFKNIEASIVPGAGAGREPVTFAPGTAPSQRTWELSKADLNTLLALSAKLDLDGEITPVMAWGMILAHPRLGQLTLQDFSKLTEELIGKVRCYGFGAVMEEFEVRDALENVLSTKLDLVNTSASGLSLGSMGPAQLSGQPFMDHGLGGHALGMHPAGAALSQPPSSETRYTPDLIQPGYAMAM
ncbi:bzip-type transcription factor [Ophiostoma piceae UAMH 11346]|uniref:Bzip-type transcription factor n=1 Tax=Ophiostoma piceae (strain UAMH 11346) TaxID=1262450 RepID=S3BQ29_OPHP1|nr:bzip-type transcription factor [Ophiostoma piceae UAMH 11346]